MSWRKRGCYLWRCDKPYALLGLPIIGRHNAYVGQTKSRRHRDHQHIVGDVTYGAPAKDWSDLRPKVYALPIIFPGWRRARLGQEWLYIRLLMPVYNVQHNRGNPRRIKPATAARQRRLRDEAKKGWAASRAQRGVVMAVHLLIDASTLSLIFILIYGMVAR